MVNSNGAFRPAHDVDSNKVFVPVWFGEINGTITDSEGTVVDSFSEPPATKGAPESTRRFTARSRTPGPSRTPSSVC